MDDRDARNDAASHTRDPSDPPGVHPRTQDVLLDHYAEMRAGVRAGDRARSRQLRLGLVAVAVVLALAYVEPGYPWVVSAVPVVLTLLFVAHVAVENRAVEHARQVAAVEHALDVPGVDYEREYGPLSTRASRLRDRLPAYALAGCFLVLWLASMAAGLVEFYENPPSVAGWTVSTAIPAVVYLVLVAMVTVAAWTYLATRSEHRRAGQRLPQEGDSQRRLDEFVAGSEVVAPEDDGDGDADANADLADDDDADDEAEPVETGDGTGPEELTDVTESDDEATEPDDGVEPTGEEPSDDPDTVE